MRKRLTRFSVCFDVCYFVPCALLLSLSSCTVQPNGVGGYVVSTPSVGQLLSSGLPGTPNSDAPLAASVYSGQVDGGSATLRVTPAGNGQYEIDLSAIAPENSGAGEVSGTIQPDGKSDGGYILTEITNGGSNPLPCALDVKFVGPSVQIMEDFNRDKEGCTGYHGAALSFDGTLSKQE